jgi:hypothetical protein
MSVLATLVFESVAEGAKSYSVFVLKLPEESKCHSDIFICWPFYFRLFFAVLGLTFPIKSMLGCIS